MSTCLFLNRSEIRTIRKKIEKHAWARDLYRRVERNARKRSVADDVEKIWARGHLSRDKALVYAIGGDDRHVPDVVDELRGMFNIDELDEPLDGVELWLYGLYRANHFWAFDLVKDHPSLRGELRRSFEAQFANILETQMAQVTDDWDSRGNTRLWYLCTIGVLGFLLGRKDAVAMAIDGKWGFKSALENLRDGLFWPEATVYGHHYVGCCLTMLAEASRHNQGEDLYHYVSASGNTLKALYDGPTKLLFADGRVASHGDLSTNADPVSKKEKHTGHDAPDTFLFNNRSYRETNRYEIAYRVYRDPVYAWILSQNPKRDHWDHTFWGYAALIHGVPLGKKSPPTAVSSVYPEYGVAILRTDETPAYWKRKPPSVYVRNGCPMAHGHFDQFNIVLNAFGKNIYPDWFIQWDYSKGVFTRGKRLNRLFFCGRTLAHNSMIVDCTEPKEREGMALSPVARQGEMTTLTVEGSTYPGVTQKRTLGLTREYLVDIFEAKSRKQHTYDYLLHSFGRLTAAGLTSRRPIKRPGAQYGLAEIDLETSRPANVWVRPGTRATCKADWRATFKDTDGIGCRVFVLGEPGTQAILTDTPWYVSSWGWDDPPADGRVRKMPFLIIRRKAKRTVFVVVHQPFRQKPARMSVSLADDVLSISGKGFKDEICMSSMAFSRSER